MRTGCPTSISSSSQVNRLERARPLEMHHSMLTEHYSTPQPFRVTGNYENQHQIYLCQHSCNRDIQSSPKPNSSHTSLLSASSNSSICQDSLARVPVHYPGHAEHLRLRCFSVRYRHQVVRYTQSRAGEDKKGHGVVWEEETEGESSRRWGGRRLIAHLLCDIFTCILPHRARLTGGNFNFWAIFWYFLGATCKIRTTFEGRRG